MKTLLRIDASARSRGSCSRQLADHYQGRWTAQNPDSRVIVRDLAVDPPPHLDGATVAVFSGAAPAGDAPPAGALLSDRLIDELLAADHLLVASPMYNFTLPSTLKAYLDHVVRDGRTFTTIAGRSVGLLSRLSATIVTARGGIAGDDLQLASLRVILEFIGITDVEVLDLAGTAAEDAEQRLAQARSRVDERFAAPAWLGPFTAEDRRELTALRAAQAAAIRRGDAEAYAALCTDDIQLMIPSHARVAGRGPFLACEARLFAGASFASFRKFPAQVELGGDLAVEVGRQEVTMAGGADPAGVFAARQKYTHIFRRTPQGWRFAVLMSNACE